MRAFIALELSEGIRTELLRLQDELKKAGANVKWVIPDNIHLTLKFLGNIDESRLSEIENVLRPIADANSPFEINLFKIGAFPDINYPRVIWAGIDKGCSQAEEIARNIEGGLEKIGFPKESRPFSAHLTLGRVRSGKNKVGLKEKLLSTSVRPSACPIKHITLFESRLTPHGPIYTARGNFPLS